MQISLRLIKEVFKMRAFFTDITRFDEVSLHILLKLLF